MKLIGPVALLLVTSAAVAQPDAEAPTDNIGHRRHFHRHGNPHPTVKSPHRFLTNRRAAELELPAPSEAFTFAVFGDRTGGPDTGVSVLADAVRDVNLFEPDLVMTVGDLVDGYNQTPEYLEEVAEYKGIMDQLLMPWFPVAGNHDVYWRGPDKPPGEHEASYEMHFGPLWYAFEHERCWFVVLYTDEGDPETGERTFGKPSAQKMSPEQFEWLRQTLRRTRGADHVFVFVHHPRWLGGGYGDDWNRVHELLVEAGNVSMVFAGHIHRMRYDGPRDGIEYVTLATVGGSQSELVPDAGWLHHYVMVTVRPGQVALASVPVGEVMDVRDITGELGDEALAVTRSSVVTESQLRLARNGSTSGRVNATLINPTTRPLAVTVLPDSDDSRWRHAPDHLHARLEPGEELVATFDVERPRSSLDDSMRPLELVVTAEMLTAGFRYRIPERRVVIPLSLPRLPRERREQVAVFDGEDDALRIASRDVRLPDGPLTVECWFNADSIEGVGSLVAKTESSGFGLFLMDGTPTLYLHLDGSYSVLRAEEHPVETGRWHHLAGVFDGAELRLYLDGRPIAAMEGSGTRTTNELPLYVGAEVDAAGGPTLFFDGRIDGARLSKIARYSEAFTPSWKIRSDDDTVVLLDMQRQLASWVVGASEHAVDAIRLGDMTLEPLPGPVPTIQATVSADGE
ncbi:MAG: LamG-like jellyroll fold domain-containing protein [Acidobacteriota bacterium]